MKRLLLIFIAIGNLLSFIHALPHQEINSKEFDELNGNYSEIISLIKKLKNSADKAPKKSGRIIHQTAWSEENNDDEINTVGKEMTQTNPTKNADSWDSSWIIKLLLNLVHNHEEEKSEEAIKSDKDNSETNNKSKYNNKSHKSISETSKLGSKVRKKHDESSKNNKVKLISNLESNSYNNPVLDETFERKEQKSETATNSPLDGKREKTTKLKHVDSSLKSDNEAFSGYEHLIDEPLIQELNRNQLIDDNYYYGDGDDDYEYCDSYESLPNSEKAATSNTTSKETTEDSSEVGGIELSNEDCLETFSKTDEELVSEIKTSNDSYSSINRKESMMHEKIFNESGKESYDYNTQSNEESINAEEEDITNTLIQDNFQQNKSTSIEQPPAIDKLTAEDETHQTTDFSNGIQNKTKYRNSKIDSLKSDERDTLQTPTISSEQNVALSTKEDQVILQEPEFQIKNNYITSTYRPSMENIELQQVTDLPSTSQQTQSQMTTPSIPDAVNYPTKSIEFQKQAQDRSIQEKSLSETSSNTVNTETDSFAKQTSLDEALLADKTSDTTRNRKTGKKNSELHAKKDSRDNQETNQELLLSLPLSSSGEYISIVSEKDKQYPITSKTRSQLSNTSAKNRQISLTSKSDKHLSHISENGQQFSNNSESDQQLLNISESDKQLLNNSERDKQLLNNSEKDKQLSNISGSDQQLSNTFENDKQLILLDTNSKSTKFEFLESLRDFIENGQEKMQPKISNLSYIHTLTKEQEEIQNPIPQNVLVSDMEKSHFSADEGTTDLTPSDSSQITNKFSYQQDGLQKNKANFNIPQVTTLGNNNAEENLDTNQNGDSLLVGEESNHFSGVSVTYEQASKNMKENKNEEYYDFDERASTNSFTQNNQKSLGSIKSYPTIKDYDQIRFKLLSDPETPYDTILQFLYKHSNNSFIQSLRNNY